MFVGVALLRWVINVSKFIDSATANLLGLGLSVSREALLPGCPDWAMRLCSLKLGMAATQTDVFSTTYFVFEVDSRKKLL